MSSDEKFLEQLFAAMEDIRLDAVVVGATAAILQGAPLITQDVDLLIRDTTRNHQKLEALARALAGSSPGPISELTSTLRMKGARVPVDFLLDRMSGGLSFASVKARSTRITIGQHSALVASLEDIVKSKAAAGRPKDIGQLPILRDTLRVKNALADEKP